MAEWLQSKLVRLGELNSDEERKDILADIKIKLGILNNRDAEQICRTTDFGQLFSQLTSSDRYHDNANFVEFRRRSLSFILFDSFDTKKVL